MATVYEYFCLADDTYSDATADNIFSVDGYYHPSPPPDAAGNALTHWIGLPKADDLAAIKEVKKLVNRDSFFARLYANVITGETVIAYRGTEIYLSKEANKAYSTVKDLATDKEIENIGHISDQDVDALEFYSWAKEYLSNQDSTNFSCFPHITGHSLGGYLAVIIATKYPGTVAVVFNAPGLVELVNPVLGLEGGYSGWKQFYTNTLMDQPDRAIYALQKSRVSANNPIFMQSIHNFNIDYDHVHSVGTQVGQVYQLRGDDPACRIHIYSCPLKGHFMSSFSKPLAKHPEISNMQITR